jgi:hypothetical protein
MTDPDPGRDLIGLVGFAMLIAVIVLAVIGIVSNTSRGCSYKALVSPC